MRYNWIKLLAMASLAVTPVSQALNLDGMSCSAKDAKVIDTVARKYFEEHSSFTQDDVSTASHHCFNHHASARLKLNPPSTVQAIVYLQKVHHQWKVILLGSAFKPQALSVIPNELRQVTGEIDETV